ncbi:MAG: AtpZ/AtpI family protein [Myxococcota bacterium]
MSRERQRRSRDVAAVERTRKDLARLERREEGGRFWRSLALIGSVGWPIVALAVGGALLGRTCDDGASVRWTLTWLFTGTALGTLLALASVRRHGSVPRGPGRRGGDDRRKR